ncbi:MAG: polysaccharide biosynthesis tyrosine autokinase [Bacteroidales bacterium]|nr:MAG: polysaccharide biosynthesis tyrosine autokinase [Bacteroidales bacterium]
MKNDIIEVDESAIDFKRVLAIIFRNWHWFLISFIVFIAAAILWNSFTTPIYKVEAKILINDEGSTFMDPQMMISQSFSPNSFKVRNEMQVLGSYSLTSEALQNLPLEANWWYKEGFHTRLIYPPPFRVIVDSTHFQNKKVVVSLFSLDETKVVISYTDHESELQVVDTVEHGAYFESTSFRFQILPNSNQKIGKKYLFALNQKEVLISCFNKIQLVDEKYSSTITIRFNDQSPQRAADFLDALSLSFLNRGVKRKNLIALNTIRFIENQLGDVTDSLRYSEEKLEAFRRIKGATNLDYQTEKAYELLDDVERDKAQAVIFLNYYDYLKSSITQNLELNKLVVPSSMGINDGVLNKLVLDLIQFYSEKAEITVNSKKDNPMLGAIDYRIEERKKAILETINGLIYSTKISIKNLDDRILKYQMEVSKIPEKEKELLSFQRNFKLNDEIYTFLLKKRSELQIASASNFPENEVLDDASVNRAVIVSPNKRLNYLMAILLSMALPFLIIYLRSQLIDKFEDSSQLDGLGYPIVGELIHSDLTGPFVVNQEHISVFTDSYRLLRTNIKFIVGGGESKVILVTSTFAKEGKSFVSRNVAASFALAGHKTILINCDLRKPEKEHFLQKNTAGLSSYLSNNSGLEELIHRSEVENLWFISSGLVPPNATELIDSPRMIELLGELKKRYAIIIVDSPPIGIVADSFIIAQHADLLLFIVRFNHSRIKSVEKILDSISQKEFKKIAIAANDLSSKYFGYGYYGYNYGYGYHYGNSEKKKKSGNRFLHRVAVN